MGHPNKKKNKTNGGVRRRKRSMGDEFPDAPDNKRPKSSSPKKRETAKQTLIVKNPLIDPASQLGLTLLNFFCCCCGTFTDDEEFSAEIAKLEKESMEKDKRIEALNNDLEKAERESREVSDASDSDSESEDRNESDTTISETLTSLIAMFKGQDAAISPNPVTHPLAMRLYALLMKKDNFIEAQKNWILNHATETNSGEFPSILSSLAVQKIFEECPKLATKADSFETEKFDRLPALRRLGQDFQDALAAAKTNGKGFYLRHYNELVVLCNDIAKDRNKSHHTVIEQAVPEACNVSEKKLGQVASKKLSGNTKAKKEFVTRCKEELFPVTRKVMEGRMQRSTILDREK